MTTEYIDTIVAGGGLIGLAIGRRLALDGLSAAVVEKEEHCGMHTSSRNSEVVHAGIYYAPNSLKALLCVKGRAALYKYADQRNIPYQRVGKLIIAQQPSDIEILESLKRNATKNGVTDLVWLSKERVEAEEPNLNAVAALRSPSTGIIDSHALLHSLEAEFSIAGGVTLLGTEVVSVHELNGALHVGLASKKELSTVKCKYFVNAAGLYAPELAGKIEGSNRDIIPKPVFARGAYFRLSGEPPFKSLIYPVPDEHSLGIHYSLDLSGVARFGPHLEWIKSIDYSVKPELKSFFAKRISTYYPALDEEMLNPDFAGVRPKIRVGDQLETDFKIVGPSLGGLKGVVHLFGIDSPGLTSVLAIADYVADCLGIECQKQD